jgi:hypothetical protein
MDTARRTYTSLADIGRKLAPRAAVSRVWPLVHRLQSE